MNIRELRLFAISLLSLSFATCVSAPKIFNGDYLTAVKSVAIDAGEDDVRNALGQPSVIEEMEEGPQWTYMFKHGRYQVPKVIIWFSERKKVTAKFINLFEQSNDAMWLPEVEKNLGKLNLVGSSEPKNMGHYFIDRYSLKDSSAGLELEVNGGRDDQISSILWTKPHVETVSGN